MAISLLSAVQKAIRGTGRAIKRAWQEDVAGLYPKPPKPPKPQKPKKITAQPIKFAPPGKITFAPTKPAIPKPTPTQPTGPGYVSLDDLEEFLHFGKVIPTTSSTNVQAMQYDADHKLLYIWFNGGTPVRIPNRRYIYSGVDEQKARRFYEAASRGNWVWREIRWPGVTPLQGPVNSAPPI